MARYYLSWDARERRRRQINRRALLWLALVLLALLLLALLVLLVILGHEVRSSGTSRDGFSKMAMASHAGYAFMFPDFMPGAGFPGLPDLWRFLFGCGLASRFVQAALGAVAVILAYRAGRNHSG